MPWSLAMLCSGAQRAVYEAVLEVHQACLDICQPGATLRQLHHVSVRLLAEALAQVCACMFLRRALSATRLLVQLARASAHVHCNARMWALSCNPTSACVAL